MLKKRKLIWYLFPSFMVITLISIVALGWYSVDSLEKLYYSETQKKLESQGFIAKSFLSEGDYLYNSALLKERLKELGENTKTRFTVILPDGKVIGDSEIDIRTMENHSDRPEVKDALNGSTGVNTRYSPSVGESFIYVALPLLIENTVVAIIRTSMPARIASGILRDFYLNIFYDIVVIALLSIAASYFISRMIVKPISDLRNGAQQFSGGNFDHKIHIDSSEEIMELAGTMNKMAESINSRIKTITLQKNELESVLSGMVEGVIAVDMKGHIVRCNRAAGELLNMDFKKATGKNIREAVRNPALNHFFERILSGERRYEEELVIRSEEDLYIQANGTLIYDIDGMKIGVLAVFNDITRLKKLETVRKEFVANVSHELKTPITSIKGFVETLREGAVDDTKNARRFLEIIWNQTENMIEMIEDLLKLSRIEQDGGSIPMQKTALNEILKNAISNTLTRAEEKNLKIELDAQAECLITGNTALIEQAIFNLLDNAVKYSDSGTSIRVDLGIDKDKTLISVSDNGRGIPQEHLPRIFERFYRVEKSRSRNSSEGTGLGLAIVKHIMQVHNGRVEVKSIPGQGSTFTLVFPTS